MDVFNLRNNLVGDYASFVQSFIHIKDNRLNDLVTKEFSEGLLWPDPLIQLNPSFETGGWIDDLVKKGVLHPECSKIFKIKSNSDSSGAPLRLHQHQVDAIEAAQSGDNYVLTTGTGSGKSLAYIVPIVDHVLKAGKGKGVKAIIVYPMNALCNSQYQELQKFLCNGYPKDHEPVRFAKYTGQENDEMRQEILSNPPDIILTNYVMLELILTRTVDKNLIKASQNLKFLVLDELHTYRGRQGADVAMLVRRTREACNAKELQCIGTSATMSTQGTYLDQQKEVATVAQKLFGDTVKPERVIGETLKRSTPEVEITSQTFIEKLKVRILNATPFSAQSYESFITDPLSIWIENTFGITTEKESGRLIRSRPRSISGENGAARELAGLTGLIEDQCITAIQQALMSGFACKNPETGFPVFAFRLHQFISKGDNVYASLEKETERYVTVNGQQFVPGDRSRILLPVVFCRECGQEYYCVSSVEDKEKLTTRLIQRDLADKSEEGEEQGYLYRNEDNPWDDDVYDERIPADWLEEKKGSIKLKNDKKKYMPRRIWVDTKGYPSTPEAGLDFHYIAGPFRFCLNCGISYDMRQRSDLGKLANLGMEGRSSATTILSLSSIRHLKKEESLELKARKLLSFTDNRQDASLQSGHFNDFIEIGLIRAALYKGVLDAGASGIRHDDLTHKVFNAMDLPIHLYAADPGVKFNALDQTKTAFRNVLGYRLYHDLRRGWRVSAPNLEQCGLLEIKYTSLEELCSSDSEWNGCHPALVGATHEERFIAAKVLLDYLRRGLAIKAPYLTYDIQQTIQHQSFQRLISPWAIDENEQMTPAAAAYPRPRGIGDSADDIFLSPRGGFGQFLRRKATFPSYSDKLNVDDSLEITSDLLKVLSVAGLTEAVREPQNDQDVPGYQIPADAMVWFAGDGEKPFHDMIRVPRLSDAGGRTNKFFTKFYREVALECKGIEAHEHTAQVEYEAREKRETDFREGRLPILYCSPTMELGVDISTLNAVNMRNVPPTPANYAQRSGRAGRSGQPALVFTYCTTGSPHDQYFYKRPELMVAGSVTPPRLDLANEDLIKAHMHAVWLAETGQYLGTSLKDILDLSGEPPELKLQQLVSDSLHNEHARIKAQSRCLQILKTIDEFLTDADWHTEKWVEDVLKHVNLSFEKACERWRGLYRSAYKQREIQNKIIVDHSRDPRDRKEAERLRNEAESQLKLLIDSKNSVQSDFYSYRYFASEGFLPGYSFPRLPLSAYIPGRKGKSDDFLSRPRFLAIAEFGPRNIIYHEGSRYIINRVIMPMRDDDQIDTSTIKVCPDCGYLHFGTGDDLCGNCKTMLEPPIVNMFRIQNVSTKRRDRINCDEEERQRQGYELKTGIRFSEQSGKISCRRATLEHPAEGVLVELAYGPAATIWRINKGWKRRANADQLGFVLDVERGYWAKNNTADEEEENDPLSPRTERVVPYVEDRRNCLLFKPSEPLALNQMASLQAALKIAIQACFQLEDNELATEPLPEDDDRKMILIYEAAEGGAGVLRRLITEPDAFSVVARMALDICHYNPDTGEDFRRAPRAREDCEAACYDCLINYGNQRDHELIDRSVIKDILVKYTLSSVKASPVSKSRAEHLKELHNLAGSSLEKKWLDFMDGHSLNLPTRGQVLMMEYETRPDFTYDEH